MDNHRFVCLAALICDDVRKEISGKDILIGVFAHNVFVGNIPTNVRGTLYMRVLFGRLGVSNIIFRVIGPNSIQVTPEIAIPLTGPDDLSIVSSAYIGGIHFQVQSEGKYEFQWKPPEQNWETVTSLYFKGGQMPPLLDPGQPDPSISV